MGYAAGQLPEAFNLQPLDADGVSLIPGIGQCDLGDRTIVAPCSWQVRHEAGRVEESASASVAGTTGLKATATELGQAMTGLRI